MFLGINHSMVDSFGQNSNPSLDLSKMILFNGRGPRHARFFFVKRSVSLSSSSWQLGKSMLYDLWPRKTIGFCTDPRCTCGSSLAMICQGVRELWWKKQTDRQTSKQTVKRTYLQISTKFWQVTMSESRLWARDFWSPFSDTQRGSQAAGRSKSATVMIDCSTGPT